LSKLNQAQFAHTIVSLSFWNQIFCYSKQEIHEENDIYHCKRKFELLCNSQQSKKRKKMPDEPNIKANPIIANGFQVRKKTKLLIEILKTIGWGPLTKEKYLFNPPKFLETKNWSIAVWAACVKKNILFYIYFFSTSELHILQALWEHEARPIPTLCEPVVKFCSKWILSSFFS
jgi:hypothetical protein